MQHYEPMVHELDARQAFSARLHQALDALGLPVRGRATWLHDRTGLSQKAVGKWLNAESMPDTKRLEGLAKLLSVDARWLLSGQGEAAGVGGEAAQAAGAGEAPIDLAAVESMLNGLSPTARDHVERIAELAREGTLSDADLGALLHLLERKTSRE